ncbi:ketopantoate reductase family protein [Candidatus Uabimicrobium amorphum]|uniref:2-dehydropantoate 2-reductase n=1 Tax=Uabimicrobium amorphum TaxID=2596890 RepID=A0A5S9F5S6_UABAM|nr:2-dehydropantoate 2-reductase N-terminal domain-containing protein [Candidatus Uabimicrobium amorphum]BBM87156.1 2-dehydropantoate 2-reductase [Candidatus Uabimicrobium amorphum]
MKILFYGAGVIGSLYAARLQEMGQNVSILARGQRLTDIRKHGIVLKNIMTGQETTTSIDVVEKLSPQDTYDLVVITLSKNCISEVLPILAANHSTATFLFMCNNAAGTDEMVQLLGKERIMLGFAGAGGIREDHVVNYAIVSKHKQPTTFGELNGANTPRLKQIVSMFKNAKFPVTTCSQMDAWLKTHVAEISPVANALYMCGGDNYRLAKTHKAVVYMIRAIREGYQVLQALNVPIVPSKHKLVKWVPEFVLVALAKLALNSKKATYLIGHAQAARSEMLHLANEFRTLVKKTSIATPAIDHLYTYANSGDQKKD